MTPPVYDSGNQVTVTIEMPKDGGFYVIPTSITASVYDETGAVIEAALSLPLPAAGTTSIPLVIPASSNVVPVGVVVSLRQVVTQFVTAAGTYSDTQTYLVRSQNPLVRMTNSFITLPETLVTRYQLSNMDGWDNATQDEQVAALVTAYKNMQQLRYRFPIGENFQSRIVDFYGMSVDNVFGRIYVVLADISFYNEIDYEGWPTKFQDALKRAQMAEANNLLSGDQVGDKRREGILSETIGESSMSFRAIPEIVMPVSRAALQHLRGYLNNAVLVARG